MGNILLIIDDQQQLTLLQHALKLAGHQTQHRASDESIDIRESSVDLILLHIGRDIEGALNILETISAEKEQHNLAIPVIVLSSVDMENLRHHSKQLGAAHYAVEPISMAELRFMVDDSLNL